MVLSSHDAVAVAALAEALLRAARREEAELSTFVPHAASEVLSVVYGQCRAPGSEAVDDGLRLRVEGPAPVIARTSRASRSRVDDCAAGLLRA